MDSRVQKRVKNTAAGAALVAGLVVVLSAGTAQAYGPHLGAGNGVDRSSNGPLLKASQPGSAAAATATLTLSASAPRLVNGAAARVTAQYSCPKGYEGYLDVELVEATGSHVSHSYGQNAKGLTCNGAKQSMDISVVVANDWPLKAGKAFARADLDTFNQDDGDAAAATERTIAVS